MKKERIVFSQLKKTLPNEILDWKRCVPLVFEEFNALFTCSVFGRDEEVQEFFVSMKRVDTSFAFFVSFGRRGVGYARARAQLLKPQWDRWWRW